MAFPTPKRITELDLASPLTDADQIAIVQGTRTKRATIAQVKTSTDTSCQCTLVSRYNAVGTDANTLEKFFQTYQLPGDTLSTEGSWLEVFSWGTTANNANNKTVEFTFGSTSFSSGTDGVQNATWFLNAIIIRTSQTTQDFFCSITPYLNSGTWSTGGGGGFAQFQTSTQDLGNDVAISISGTNGTASANDITCEGLIIRVNHMDANS